MGNPSGFSIMELLITLVISILLIAFALPSYTFFIHQSQNEVMAQQLLHAINYARSEALARSDNVTLCASEDGVRCSENWLAGYIITTQEAMLAHYQNQLTDGIMRYRFFPQGRALLSFNGSGLADFENGTLWYCRQLHELAVWAIVINQSGRARLEVPNEAGVIVDSQGKTLSC